MVHRKKIHDIICHVNWQPYCLKKKPSKIFFEVAEQIEAKLYLYDRLPVHEEGKVHTYDVIGHMVWQPYWIYP